MRKTTTIVSCDNPTCRQYGEVEDLKNSPEGWYRVARSDDRQTISMTVGTFDVCSLKCLSQWARQREQALKALHAREQPLQEPHANGNGEDAETKNNRAQAAESIALVVMALEEADRPLKRSEIREITGLAESTVTRAANALIHEGRVTEGLLETGKGPTGFAAVYELVRQEVA
jgi:hypothetical protein